MAKKTKKKAAKKKSGPKKGVAYLTKRALNRAISKGTKDEQTKAIKLMGYVIKEDKGWIVKEYASGEKERLSKIKRSKSSYQLALD